MNRFLSSHKTLIAAFALFLSAAALPTHAQTLVSNKNFSLTFPAGWTASSIGSGDSAISLVMQFATGSIGYLYGIPHTGLLTAQEIAALMANYGAGDSLEVTASGTKKPGTNV